MQSQKKAKDKTVKKKAVWRKTGQPGVESKSPELNDKKTPDLNDNPLESQSTSTVHEKLPNIDRIRSEERPDQAALADYEDSDTALPRYCRGRGNTNAENNLEQNTTRSNLNSKPARLGFSRSITNKTGLKNEIGDEFEGYLPEIADPRKVYKSEREATHRKNSKGTAAKTADGGEKLPKKMIAMQDKGKRSEKSNKAKQGGDIKRNEYIKFDVAEDIDKEHVERGALDVADHRNQLAGVDNTEQNICAPQTRPHDHGSPQSRLERSLPGGTLSACNSDQSGDNLAAWLTDETDDRNRKRSTGLRGGSSITVDDIKRQLYNEAYCMQKMKLTKGHTFSFFSMHPFYKMDNNLSRNGGKKVNILKFKPIVTKPLEKDETELTDAPKKENKEINTV